MFRVKKYLVLFLHKDFPWITQIFSKRSWSVINSYISSIPASSLSSRGLREIPLLKAIPLTWSIINSYLSPFFKKLFLTSNLRESMRIGYNQSTKKAATIPSNFMNWIALNFPHGRWPSSSTEPNQTRQKQKLSEIQVQASMLNLDYVYVYMCIYIYIQNLQWLSNSSKESVAIVSDEMGRECLGIWIWSWNRTNGRRGELEYSSSIFQLLENNL